jgi:hypothetical protein
VLMGRCEAWWCVFSNWRADLAVDGERRRERERERERESM